MEKKYDLNEENNNPDRLSEPAIEYGRDTELTFSPPLTEEELKEALTTEQVKEHLRAHIHKLFNQK